MFDPAALRARLQSVRDRVARAAGRARRDPSTVRLVAVSKTFAVEDIRYAAAAGQRDFGENKVQEALAKMAGVQAPAVRWHLIGHLQSNKARKAAEHFDVIHSVDSVDLVTRLDEAAGAAGRMLELLAQVDLAGEATKHGVPPAGVRSIFDAASRCRSVRIVGLMIIPPAVADADEARPFFAALRRLADQLRADGVDPAQLGELSMGMSHDFEVAIEEGATMVRVGSAIFGERNRV